MDRRRTGWQEPDMAGGGEAERDCHTPPTRAPFGRAGAHSVDDARGCDPVGCSHPRPVAVISSCFLRLGPSDSVSTLCDVFRERLPSLSLYNELCAPAVTADEAFNLPTHTYNPSVPYGKLDRRARPQGQAAHTTLISR